MALSWTTRLCPLGDDLSDSAAEPVAGCELSPAQAWRQVAQRKLEWRLMARLDEQDAEIEGHDRRCRAMPGLIASAFSNAGDHAQ